MEVAIILAILKSR